MSNKNWINTILDFASDCKGKLILSVVMASIGVFFSIIPYWSVYKLMAVFIEQKATGEDVLYYGAIGIIAYFIRYICHGVSTILSHISAYTILRNIRENLGEKLLSISMGNASKKTIGEYKSIIVDKVETIEMPLAHIIPECVAALLLSLGIAIFMVFISWEMALAMFITVPFALMAYKKLMGNFNQLYEAQMKSNKYMNSTIVEYISGIEVIKTFNQDSNSYKKYKDAVNLYKDHTLNWFKSTWSIMNFASSILPSTFLGTLPVGMILYLNGTLTPAEFCICLMLSLGIVIPLTQFTNYVNLLKSIEYAVKDINEILCIPNLISIDNNEHICTTNIKFNNVFFSYDNENSVLENINIEIPQNSFTAIVGPSGSGKSTIIKLISRYWDVCGGEITIGGKNVKDISLNQLNDLIGYVSQNNFLFNESIMENIRMGNPDASDEEVIEVSKICACHDFIIELEEGYNSNVGSLGSKLSGGQRQRISIARMMLKNAPIILLDEATAFIDPDNEEKIQGAINVLTKNKTLIVVAHRLSTIKNADKIVVLKNKTIFDTGTHDELLEKCDLYKNMWLSHIGAKSKSIVSNIGG
ncbi:TPA: ABC transporter ATP-binding protein [Streptococcus pneumoniae]